MSQTLGMFKLISCSVHLLVIQHIQASQVCLWRNETASAEINCSDVCCASIATSPESICCANKLRSGLAVPLFLITAICLLGICIVYFRPFIKHCCCGCKLPGWHRSEVISANLSTGNTNPVYHINNDDLPDYETICKESPPKDMTPPPYIFVTTHAMDFGIAPRVPSAPPQYSSRPNSAVSVRPLATVQS